MLQIIAYVTIGLIALGLISTTTSTFNRLILLKNNVDKAFANIDVLLKQRADEIPNLIKIVKESMQYEEKILIQLTHLRTNYLNATTQTNKIAIANEIDKQYKSIWAVAENYPDLKANINFNTLQQRISLIEDAIADRREFFNESITMYNIGIAEFPNFILAKLLMYSKKELLKITEEEKKYNGITF